MADTEAIFYDCEVSSLEGTPIEIGRAFADAGTDFMTSGSHFNNCRQSWPEQKPVCEPERQRPSGATTAPAGADACHLAPLWTIVAGRTSVQ